MRPTWKVKLGLALVATSAALLSVHFLIFRDLHHIAIFGFQEIAMMPIEVLVVTLILHSVLERREREEMLNKLNMVIGAFFSEVGSELLRRVSALDEEVEVREHFLFDATWTAARYEVAKKAVRAYDYGIQVDSDDLTELRAFIVGKRQFLLGLLENPNLLEHQTFTDALWAVFHLTEELEARPSFHDLPESDRQHLIGDTKRAYAALGVEWLDYARHLQKSYPYLFSLVVRLNPLDPNASVTVTEVVKAGEWYGTAAGDAEIDNAWIEGPAGEAPVAAALAPEATGDGIGEVPLPLPMGALTLGQLDLLFRVLPFDMTYVDENDRVRFYTEGERVFSRTPGAIGREVRNCHPPHSLHKVEEILTSFKDGTKDIAEFWIEMGPKFVHIRYYALRDEGGAYKGCLEVVQDATHVRSLSGNRRIVDW